MALTIKNRDVERLVAQIASFTGETKTEAVRRALAERYARLRTRVVDASRGDRVLRFLETEVWSRVPEDQIGRMPSKAERERILGYERGGV